MVFTITIIWRARWILGVAMAKALRSSAAVGEWQNVQSFPIAFANIPIASKNVSTGIPLSSWTFLKMVSLICGAGAWALRVAAPSRHAAASAVVQRKVLDPSIMISLRGSYLLGSGSATREREASLSVRLAPIVDECARSRAAR